MDQEDTMDFKALRAKFQDEQLLLKQPRIKPALPEKPKVLPPPTSPVHHLPAGARPSLLTSINQGLEARTSIAPRVVFKDDKKESKKPLILSNAKAKEKSEGKTKGGKDKATKGSKEKLNANSPDQKQKKESIIKDKKLPLVLPVAPKESTAELVPATPPPKAATLKKKGFLGFKRLAKKETPEVSADSILDSPSTDAPGPAPLIPVPILFGGTAPDPEIHTPRALMPPTLPISTPATESPLPSSIPASSDITLPPAFIPDIPAPQVPTPDSEIPLEIETPALPVSLPHRPASPDEIIPSPPSTVPTPPPTRMHQATPTPAPSTPSPSPPQPKIAGVEAAATVESPPPPVVDPPSIPSSPKLEHPVSALSALERAEEMGPGKRTPPCDLRVFSALEKARKKTGSPSTPSSVTPPPEELQSPPSPTQSLIPLPPIDYEDRAGNAAKAKPAQVNGVDHRQASPVLEGIAEEGSDAIPELMVVPPPPPRKPLPHPESLGPAPEKPSRPPSLSLTTSRPSTPEDSAPEIPAPPEFSETDAVETPEFEDVGSDSPDLPGSEWANGENAGPDSPDGQTFPETMNLWNNNETPFPRAEVPIFGGIYHDNHQPHPSSPVLQDFKPVAGPQAEDDHHGAYECAENAYEEVGAFGTKKRGKNDGGKKRKGPPKNPYAESAQEVVNEEKTKTGRFGKNDKKTTAEGPDEKELKKKEKQRLEKEKKELKEQKEREKREQKEREKKESEREKRENEMKKKFKITGQEDTMYQAKVTVTTKGRKNDLPVKSGDIVSIIRTTNCPKGKWLAREDSSNTYGYVAVDHVELDIKEMLEMGKKAAITRKHGDGGNVIDGDVASTGSRASNRYPQSTGSFTDDSEEWTCDDDDPVSSPTDAVDALSPLGHTRTHSMPDIGNNELSINHQHSHSDNIEGTHIQARHEALQKLATFFHSPKPVVEPNASTEPETSAVVVQEEAAHPRERSATQEVDFGLPDNLILPPPDLYADINME